MAYLGVPESDSADVRQLELFRDMADEHFSALMRGAYVQHFPPQIELITEGDTSDFLHVILTGSVDLFSRWNGRERSMATVRPVSTFILAATVKDAPYLMSARTLEKSRIALIPSQDVRAVFDRDNGFARAIVTDPLVLLADEPTGNLDTARSREIMELITRLNTDQGITVVMVTHEPDMAEFARRHIHFVDGRIASDDTRKAA